MVAQLKLVAENMDKFDNGIYNNLNIDAYHNADGISSTGINLMLDCPARFYHEYYVNRAFEPTDKPFDKFELGRAVHALILEPDVFNATYYCMDEKVNLTTKAGKEIMAKAQAEAGNRKVLRAGEWEDIKAMAQSALMHPIWNKLKDGKVEQSIFWNPLVCVDVQAKSRPDIYNDEYIIDVKTTESIKQFSKSIYNFGYHRQAAMQMDALYSLDKKSRQFLLFVVEKRAPYLTACFALTEDSIEQGREEYFQGVQEYADCMADNDWYGYGSQVSMISIPEWAKSKK